MLKQIFISLHVAKPYVPTTLFLLRHQEHRGDERYASICKKNNIIDSCFVRYQVQYAMEISLTTIIAVNIKDQQLSVRALGQINSCKLNPMFGMGRIPKKPKLSNLYNCSNT